ncbi:hypothetical protein CBM2592_A280091 [Cupriavidus taiwanensis]|nr:hypothetical protein CBM2592_A280091 [Cupriavidus taiwanensis]SOY52831.1 hypothetical protein CBM2588_A240091 [Cupriavidus taiwanensis]SOY85722.1 hypothetical protein CBM2591_A320090 [Cupriavidus taiwanensis]SOZ60320.1 hypothetical protein CBM2617_A330088 [Cupriavidus taiwanensis]SOZ80557.1 hypothetical protein CBM2618_A290090 [Cupriavidus taiwanensis]
MERAGHGPREAKCPLQQGSTPAERQHN